MRKLVFLSMLALLSAGSCDKTIYCTEEFRMITVEVMGKNLDKTRTIRILTGDTLDMNRHSFAAGTYVILTDAEMGLFRRKQEHFRFQGLIGDSLVVDEVYLIGHDECHIDLIEGRTRIEL
jgi:hypothetical protein